MRHARAVTTPQAAEGVRITDADEFRDEEPPPPPLAHRAILPLAPRRGRYLPRPREAGGLRHDSEAAVA
jgi:hypothetical protein